MAHAGPFKAPDGRKFQASLVHGLSGAFHLRLSDRVVRHVRYNKRQWVVASEPVLKVRDLVANLDMLTALVEEFPRYVPSSYLIAHSMRVCDDAFFGGDLLVGDYQETVRQAALLKRCYGLLRRITRQRPRACRHPLLQRLKEQILTRDGQKCISEDDESSSDSDASIEESSEEEDREPLRGDCLEVSSDESEAELNGPAQKRFRGEDPRVPPSTFLRTDRAPACWQEGDTKLSDTLKDKDDKSTQVNAAPLFQFAGLLPQALTAVATPPSAGTFADTRVPGHSPKR
jgi:hypothetical protein